MSQTNSREGLYEHLVSRAVKRWLADLVGLTSEVKEADSGEISLRLARHIAAEAERALRSLKGAAGVEQQVALCNALLRELHEHVPETGDEDSEIVPTAYIGSANLSQAALFGGHEWMMKVAEADLPDVIEQFRGAFDSLWEDAEFEPFCPEDEAARQRLRQALRQQVRQQAHGGAAGRSDREGSVNTSS